MCDRHHILQLSDQSRAEVQCWLPVPVGLAKPVPSRPDFEYSQRGTNVGEGGRMMAAGRTSPVLFFHIRLNEIVPFGF